MTAIVPLDAVPSQTLTAVMSNQSTRLNLYQKLGVLYMDVYVNDAPIILGVQCENANRIVRSAYLGFVGDLAFIDTQGSSDPTFDGLGSRFQLVYLSQVDLSKLGFAA